MYPELQSEGLARELINRVQRLRKKAGLNTTDDIKVEYKLIKDTINFENVIKDHEDILVKSTKRPLEPFTNEESKVIIDEEQTINDTTFNLRLLRI
mmetsp:Transcript_148/g.192  ORF Transcript_148/g.192 Transcript_148/m.192 type:complete len:96 (-) Transcript_148:103-390(-)